MWDKLVKQVAVEREQLRHLLEVHRPLVEECATREPTGIELSALAAMLHSFYTGAENLFKRIAIERGEPLPSGDAWHQELLRQMARPAAGRGAILPESLGDRLAEYLGSVTSFVMPIRSTSNGRRCLRSSWDARKRSASWNPHWTVS